MKKADIKGGLNEREKLQTIFTLDRTGDAYDSIPDANSFFELRENWMNLVLNWNAFRKGYKASKKFNGDPSKVKNPYPKETNKYYGWNQGWNSHKED